MRYIYIVFLTFFSNCLCAESICEQLSSKSEASDGYKVIDIPSNFKTFYYKDNPQNHYKVAFHDLDNDGSNELVGQFVAGSSYQNFLVVKKDGEVHKVGSAMCMAGDAKLYSILSSNGKNYLYVQMKSKEGCIHSVGGMKTIASISEYEFGVDSKPLCYVKIK
ncbi:hypothetical protein [Colwellia echini]|uniref:Uncharacterized protein n=1 Tax=Colwellia echini TaxID=1982103 RepID=A0ABY3MSX0_9GAMM|nr:hypothetical protein [Colwellia echini]TYK64207.1 hypothetical protein CWS31_016920 [Colwellia echini]